MRIELNDIPHGGLERHLSAEAAAFPLLADLAATGEAAFPQAVVLQARIVPREGDFVLHGRFETVARLACGRCLQAFEAPLTGRFRLRFSRAAETPPQTTDPDGIELTAAQIETVPLTGEAIDLADAFQEQILMALPLRPLCRNTCRGLCPRCGTDLNAGACTCSEARDDNPFAALKGLKLPPGRDPVPR